MPPRAAAAAAAATTGAVAKKTPVARGGARSVVFCAAGIVASLAIALAGNRGNIDEINAQSLALTAAAGCVYFAVGTLLSILPRKIGLLPGPAVAALERAGRTLLDRVVSAPENWADHTLRSFVETLSWVYVIAEARRVAGQLHLALTLGVFASTLVVWAGEELSLALKHAETDFAAKLTGGTVALALAWRFLTGRWSVVQESEQPYAAAAAVAEAAVVAAALVAAVQFAALLIAGSFDDLCTWERRHIMYRLQSMARSRWCPGLPSLMASLGNTCTGEGLVVIFAFLCWCVDNRAGVDGIWLVPVAEITNGCVKWFFGRPRPGWNDPKIEVLSTSHEYSFPSSHAMISWSLATFFSAFWWPAGGIGSYVPYTWSLGVSVSRVFEGAHYPHDITVGALLGIALGRAHLKVLPWAHAMSAAQASPAPVVAAGVATSLVGLGAVLVCYAVAGRRWGSSPPQEWCENCGIPERKGPLSPHWVPLGDYVSMCGVLAGLGIAEPIFDPTRPGLLLPPQILGRFVRFLVGVSVLLGLFFGVRAVEKSMVGKNSVWSLPLRFIRYGQVPPVILFLAPACFEALGV